MFPCNALAQPFHCSLPALAIALHCPYHAVVYNKMEVQTTIKAFVLLEWATQYYMVGSSFIQE
jgi:hypothetical protein